MQTRNIYRDICYLFAFIMLFFFFVMPASGKTVTYVKEYTYQASEVDSKLSCRTIALEQVKRLLLEELGTYLISETVIKDFELTKDQISSLTAGLVMTVILDEKWDGKTYFLRAKITAETDNLLKSLDTYRKDQGQSKELDEMRKKTEQALKEIAELKKQIGKGQPEKKTQEKYAKAVNDLNATDWYKKGYALRYVDKNNQEAMKAMDKAIELDPKYAMAYAIRGAIYNEWGQYSKGLRNGEQAIKFDPSLAIGFHIRGVAYEGLGNYFASFPDFNKAIELDPKWSLPYCSRSWANYKLRYYSQALEDANKAIGLNPQTPMAYYFRGRIFLDLDKTQDAINDFNKAIKLNPTYSWSFLFRGRAFLKLDKTQQALEDFKRSASLGNSEAQSYIKEKKIQ